jgi:hypothetical protein
MKLKESRPLREAVLHLLDVLVENGSSAAYRMRDDFVTPLTAGLSVESSGASAARLS